MERRTHAGLSQTPGTWSLGAPHGTHVRAGVAVAVTLLYVIVFILAFPKLGLAMAAVATVPVSVIAYLWGTSIGVAAAIAFAPIHVALLWAIFGAPLGPAVQSAIGPGQLMLIGVGFVVGRMADMGRQIRAQQSVLVAERHALQEWQDRYSHLVMTLAAGVAPEPVPGAAVVATDARDATDFRRFLARIMVACTVFGVAELTFGIAFSLPRYAALGVVAIAYAAATYAARRALDRDLSLPTLGGALALSLVAAGIVGVMLAPAQATAIALVPVIGGAMTLRFVSGRALHRLLLLCWLGSVAIAGIGELALPATATADPFNSLIRLTGWPAAAALIFSMLAAESSRQRMTIDELNRHHFEASLAEDRYRGLFDSLPIGLYRTTPSGLVLDANPAMVQMLGYESREAMLASSVHGVYVDAAQRDAWCGEIERSGLVVAAELEMRRPDGTRLWIRDTARLVRGPDGEPLYFDGAAEDITDPKRLAEQLRHQAFHDTLTGLANRRLFLERLGAAIARGRQDGVPPAVLFLDLDDFKLINDSLGHDVGDQVLRSVATRLVGAVRRSDMVARLGGDEFTVLLAETDDPDSVTRIADGLRRTLAAPVVIADREVVVNASIGIAFATGYAEEALGQADIAMYAAKRRGKGRSVPYDPSMHDEAWRRLEIEAQLRGVAARGELAVHYQPIVDLRTGSVRSLEALVRWDHPTLGLLPPSAFMDAAEKTGTVAEIDRFVLATACEQLAAWRRELGMPALTVNANLSAVALSDGSITDAVRDAVTAAGLEPSAICLEITESSLLADNLATDRVLNELRQLGVRLALDDFGAGFSNLGYLKRLPVDELKIDRSLVADVPGTPRDEAILKAAVAFGRSLGLVVILEGVETAEQLAAGLRVGADLAQGYLASPPRPPEDIAEMLENVRTAVHPAVRPVQPVRPVLPPIQVGVRESQESTVPR